MTKIGRMELRALSDYPKLPDRWAHSAPRMYFDRTMNLDREINFVHWMKTVL